VSYYVPKKFFFIGSNCAEQTKRWPTRGYISDGNW